MESSANQSPLSPSGLTEGKSPLGEKHYRGCGTHTLFQEHGGDFPFLLKKSKPGLSGQEQNRGLSLAGQQRQHNTFLQPQ